jgi:hypothetical protein
LRKRLRRRRVAVGITVILVSALVAIPQVWHVPPVITGTVRAEDGQPLAGAVVRARATAVWTLTDAEGRFTLAGFDPAFRVRLTAWQDGYYIAGANATPWDSTLSIVLAPYRLALGDHADYRWVLPAVEPRSTMSEWAVRRGMDLAAIVSFDRALLPLAGRLTLGCADCHGDMVREQWGRSAHALGTQNPRFMSAYNGTDLNGNQSPVTEYVQHRDYGLIPLPPDPDEPYYGPGFRLDFPESAGNCATCHAPSAALAAPHDTPLNAVTGVDAQGVHCDFCHKIVNVTLDPATGAPRANMPGVLSIELLRPGPERQLFFGPYDDVDVGPDTYLPLVTESAACAACHSASFWGVPIYESFPEWLASPYASEGTTCQDCHMRPDGVTDNFAPGRGGQTRDPDTIATHDFPGAGSVELLQETAELSLRARRDGPSISVEVTVTNSEAGHHLPTDSPLRQVLLVVTATNGEGRALALTAGPALPDWAGDLAGEPGVYFAKVLEQLWTEVAPTAAYWTQTRIVEDTRIPARETRTSRYAFEAQPGGGAVTVEAFLIFRRAYYELLQQKGWETPDILMEHSTTTVPATGPGFPRPNGYSANDQEVGPATTRYTPSNRESVEN